MHKKTLQGPRWDSSQTSPLLEDNSQHLTVPLFLPLLLFLVAPPFSPSLSKDHKHIYHCKLASDRTLDLVLMGLPVFPCWVFFKSTLVGFNSTLFFFFLYALRYFTQTN